MSRTLIPIDIGQKKPYLLEISHHDATIRGLPAALHGATFVHLSDLHGGNGNTEPVYEEAIARVTELAPDLILFTGDYIDDNAKPKDFPIQQYLSRFSARLGMFGCLGNHDHRRGPVGAKRIAEAGGIRILTNESVCLESGLWIAGIDDLAEGKPDIERTFADIPPDVTPIVLSHHPRLIEQIPQRDALILSGHTHGGQIALPLLSPKVVCWAHLRCRQVAGWYKNGRAREYVNRGLGVTGNLMRLNCPAEIGVFRLLPAETSAPSAHGEKIAQPAL